MPQLDDLERTVLNRLASRRDDMIDLLREVVNLDSGSYDKDGVDSVGATFRRHLEASGGISTKIVSHADWGDNFVAELPGQAEGPHILLLGHMDTVFKRGVAAERPFRIEGDRAYGPGVADMKAGLVMNTFVMEAFAEAGGAPLPLKALYTGDEEVASPASRPVIEEYARGAKFVLNAEPGRPSGNVVMSRKGAAFLKIEAFGRPAHSGVEPGRGASAISALARKIIRLDALNEGGTETTVNVGILRGGESVNMVAPYAMAEVDIRFRTEDAMRAVLAAVEDIVAAEDVKGVEARITQKRNFMPLKASPQGEALFAAYQAAARDAGFEVGSEFTGGSADSGFAASVGAPTLCATGPVGGRAHTPEEYCEIETLAPRAQAVALTIIREARQADELRPA